MERIQPPDPGLAAGRLLALRRRFPRISAQLKPGPPGRWTFVFERKLPGDYALRVVTDVSAGASVDELSRAVLEHGYTP